MNAFDYSIISGLNQFVGRHPLFDRGVSMLANNGFLRGGSVAALCWWLWFKHGEDETDDKERRETIISAILACFVAVLLARLLAFLLPFRIRPIADPTNGLQFPASDVDWQNWSSFPSDHAVMFFTLTTALFYISRVAGWIALLDTVFLVCLTRIYLGYHHPTDILAGAVIGISCGFVATRKGVRSFAARGAFRWLEKSPGTFYAFFFLFMYQLSVIFWDLRLIVVSGAKLVLKH